MSDSYQAIYDAVRSRISGGNISDVAREVLADAFDFSHARAIIQQEFCIAASELTRPSVLYRPTLSVDGDQWFALYGADIQSGVAGFGSTPAEAMSAFDAAWANEKRRTVTPPSEPPAWAYRRPLGECATCDKEGDGMMPSHTASDRCESGKHNHCTCDACF